MPGEARRDGESSSVPSMLKLIQFRLCPLSRAVRLVLAELEQPFELVEERPWEFRPGFLALNPAGEVPVLQLADGPVVCGAFAITEYLAEGARHHPAEVRPFHLFPGDRDDRAEVRRLVDWFNGKLNREVTRELVAERIVPRVAGRPDAPEPDVMRAMRANLRYHLGYVSFLAHQRRWLAGDEPSLADLAAAAHLSVIDYVGEVPWEQFGPAKEWYARVKSRRSFRALLADRLPGLPPPLHYTDLDF